MGEKGFKISVPVDVVRKIDHGEYGGIEVILEFETPEGVISALLEYLRQVKDNQEVVQDWVACVDETPLVYGSLRREIIQILEGKFGYKCIAPKVKVIQLPDKTVHIKKEARPLSYF